MRLWHKSLIPYLPGMQLRGQWRECALIAHEIKERGTPNHLLVNRVLMYSMSHFYTYCICVLREMQRRGFGTAQQSLDRVEAFGGKYVLEKEMFEDWHNKEYLRVCMANLYEKHIFGIGKSHITDEEWRVLRMGYKEITGEEYEI